MTQKAVCGETAFSDEDVFIRRSRNEIEAIHTFWNKKVLETRFDRRTSDQWERHEKNGRCGKTSIWNGGNNAGRRAAVQLKYSYIPSRAAALSRMEQEAQRGMAIGQRV